MTTAALLLTLSAALLHAAWNALSKRARQPFLFLWLTFSVAALLLTPPGLWMLLRNGFDGRASLPLLISSVVHAIYFYALGAAYQRAYLSQVYPIARGLGVALVPILARLLLEESLSLEGGAAVLLVTGGIGLISLERGQRRQGGRGGLAWAVLTGLAIAGYSLNDAIGVRFLHPLPYVWLMGTASMALLLPAVLQRRAALLLEWRAGRRSILIAASISHTAYLLVLLAFRLARTSYVVAGRELSIVISTLIGGLWLGEGWPRLRLIGCALIVIGVVVLGQAR